MLLLSTLLAWGLVFLFPGPPQKSPPSVDVSPGYWGPTKTAVLLGMSLVALLGFLKSGLGSALWLSTFYMLGVLCAAGIRSTANFLLKRFAPGSNSNAGRRIAATTFLASCLLVFFDICHLGYMPPFAPIGFVCIMPVTAFTAGCLEMARWFWIKIAQARNEESKE